MTTTFARFTRPAATMLAAILALALVSAPRPALAAAPSDTFQVLRHSFQDRSGVPQARGWTGLDLVPRVFAHVSDRFVANAPAFAGLEPTLVGSNYTGVPTTSRINQPRAVALGDSGRVVYVDFTVGGENAIYQVYPGTLRRLAQLTSPLQVYSVTLDPTDNSLLVGVFNAIYRIPDEGAPVQIAGGGAIEPDTSLASAYLGYVRDMAVDSQGNIYYVDDEFSRVRMIRANDQRVITLVGDPNGFSQGSLTANFQPGTSTRMRNPFGIALDEARGLLFIADTGNAAVIAYQFSDQTTFASDGFTTPQKLAISGGKLFIELSSEVWARDLTTGDLQRVAGGADFFTDPGNAGLGAEARLANLAGLAPDGAGGVYFTSQRLLRRLRSDGVLEHVAGEKVDVLMGARALWFGADSTSAPDVVARWVHPWGFGNGWGQRLVSPPVPATAASGVSVTFDAAVELLDIEGIQFPYRAEFLAVEALDAGGAWRKLNTRWRTNLGSETVSPEASGRALAKAVTRLDADGNNAFVYAFPLRLRIAVQSNDRLSSEDGSHVGTAGGVVLDNLRVLFGNSDLIPPADFEDGGTGEWSRQALNGAYQLGSLSTGTSTPTRTLATLPGTSVALSAGTHPSNTTPGWKFLGTGGNVNAGTYARLESPWLAAPANDTTMLAFAGQLPNQEQGTLVSLWARGKNAGDTRPRFYAPTFTKLLNLQLGADNLAPYLTSVTARFPIDFDLLPNSLAPGALVTDSIQFVIQVEDVRDSHGATPVFLPSRLPVVDDVRVFAVGNDASGTPIDADADGVPIRTDAQPAVSSAGQDADADGAPDPTSSLRQVRTWVNADRPIRFRISAAGLPSVPDDSEILAVRAGMLQWAIAPGAETPVLEDAASTLVNASALDGVNLVTFQDPDVVFAPGVLAQTAVTTYVGQGAYDDRIVLPGQVLDADMIFNPGVSFATDTHPGTYSLKGVATHEFGHFFSLSHSASLDATMFYVIQPGEEAYSLATDDLAAISGAYPGATLGTDYGTITGTVTRGSDATPIAGAVVTATRVAGGAAAGAAVTDYTREDGTFALRHLDAGDYAVRVDPLDGSANGLTADRVNERLAAIVQTNFEPEWHSSPENATDDPSLFATLAIAPGSILSGIDIVTNTDTIPPAVVAVTPVNASTDLGIDALVTVAFSEPIAPATLSAAFRLRPQGGAALGGIGQLIGGTRFVFAPADPLAFGTTYEIEISAALTDDEGVPLAAPWLSTFSTGPQPPLAILRVTPPAAPVGAILTLECEGIAGASGAANVVFQDGVEPIVVTASILDTRTVLVRVPNGAVSQPIQLEVDGDFSNTFAFTVLPPPQQAAPVPYGDAVSLAFDPLDVAISPDGATAFAVGSGGLVSVDITAAARSAILHSPDPATHVALTPDGALAVVSRPAASRVDIVDALPTSGTFGQVLHSVPGLDQPGPIAIGPNGRRAHVVHAVGQVAEIDLDAASPTAWQVIAQRSSGSFGPASTAIRQLAMDPRGSGLFLAYSSIGTRRWQLTPDSLPPGTSTSAAAWGGLAVSPDGLAVFGLHGSLAQGLLTTVNDDAGNSATFGTSLPVSFSGSPSDVAIAREGQSAFVTNRTFNEMSVVDILPGSPTQGSVVASVPTGNGPSVVAVSALAAVIGVGNSGNRTLGFYTYDPAGTPTVRDVQSPVSLADAVVSVLLSDSVLVEGSQVEVGGQVLAPTNQSFIGLSFVAPAIGQQTTTLSVLQPGGARSLQVPFTIAAPPPPLTALEGPSQKVEPAGYFCFGDEGSGVAEVARLSPNGRVLAVAAYGAYAECNRLYFFRMDPSGLGRLGEPLGSWPNNRYLTDWEWTADSRQIWVAIGNGSSFRVDADPASPTFAQTIGGFGSPANGQPSSLAVDPLGRYIVVGGLAESSGLALFRPDGTEIQSTGYADFENLVISPDGRHLVGNGSAGPGSLRFIELGAGTVIPTDTPALPGMMAPMRITFTSDGKRAVALHTNSNLAVYNLDPAAGPLYGQLYFGQPVPAASHNLTDVVPGSSPYSVVAASSSSPILFEIDARNGAVIGQAPLDSASNTVARSPDGRSYWTFPTSRGGPGGGMGSWVNFHPTLFTNHAGTQLTLLTGGAPTVPPGEPVAIRVRVTGTDGSPEIGVPLRLRISGLVGTLSTMDRLTDAGGEGEFTFLAPPAAGPYAITVSADGIAGSIPVSLTVAGSGADIPPAIVQFGPATGATGINAGSAVSVRFNQPMVLASLEPALALSANGTPVAGTLRLADGDRLAIFTPGAPLPFDAACVLTVAPGPLDADGQALTTGGTSSFTVQSPPTLALTGLSPPAGPPGAPVSILGTGFSTTASSNIVTFEGTLASVTNAEPLVIGTHVPLAATTGAVEVRIGGTTSNPLAFTVLSPNPTPGGVIGSLVTSAGVREVEVTPDGSRAYCTNPLQNDVTALDMATTAVITRVPVGLAPQGLAIVPSGRRMYVANQGSDDVSVVDVDPASPSYHAVVNTIPVGDEPVGVAIANQAGGVKVVVSNAASGTLSIIDAEPNNATFEQVTATSNVGSGGKGGNIVITNDGGTAFVATSTGVVSVNLVTGEATTIPTSDAVVDIDITPQGTVVLALLEDGTILVIGAVPGSDDFNQVVATANTGSGGKGGNIVITNDGALAYVTNPDGGTVIVFAISDPDGSGASVALPGAPVTLSIVTTIEVGGDPLGLATDPNGKFITVVSPSAGGVTVIGLPASLPPVTVEFDFRPNVLNVRSIIPWVLGFVEPPAPWTVADIAVDSLRLEEVIGPSRIQLFWWVDDRDHDGVQDLAVMFPRWSLGALLPEGDKVPVRLSGRIGTRRLAGVDSIRVRNFRIQWPIAGCWTRPNEPLDVSWDRPIGTSSLPVTLLWSRDHGATWQVAATGLSNTGHYSWMTPDETLDSAQVAVAIVESGDPLSGDFTGYISSSQPFVISPEPLAAPVAPAELSFAGPSPNPARGRAALRFGLPQKSDVRLEVFDVRGRRVRTLLDGERAAGWHVLDWNGADASGSPAGSGMYFVRLTVGERRLEHRLTLLR